MTPLLSPLSSSSSSFSTLALELKHRIACFLDPLDAGRDVVQTVLGIPPVVALLPAQHVVANGISDISETDEPIRFMPVDIPKQAGVETHSVQLQFRWQDQGWGNRKGRLYIVQNDPNSPPNPNARFAGGKLICETEEDAPHEPGQGSLLWHLSDHDQYSIWYKVGGGGGHALRVTNFSLTKYIFDDAYSTYSKTYRRLHDVGALRYTTEAPGPEADNIHIRHVHFPLQPPSISSTSFQPNRAFQSRFFPRLLLGICEHFLRAQQSQSTSAVPLPTADPDLVATFQEFQLDTDEASVRAVQYIIQHELLLHEKQVAAEAEAPPPRPHPRNVREFLEQRGILVGAGMMQVGEQPQIIPPQLVPGPPDAVHHLDFPPQEAEQLMREVLEHVPVDMEMPFGAIMGWGVNGQVVFEHVIDDENHNHDDEREVADDDANETA
jgi:hypothetical protein